MKSFLDSIQIINIDEEKPFFITVRIRFSTSKTILLQFHPDKFTYHQLSKVVSPRFLNQKINRVRCLIPLTPRIYSLGSNVEWIIWDIFGQSKKFSFLCSPTYKLFINKLRNAKNREELIEAFCPLNNTMVQTDLLQQTQKMDIKKRNKKTKAVPRSLPRHVYSMGVLMICFFVAALPSIFGFPSKIFTSENNIIVSVGTKIPGFNLFEKTAKVETELPSIEHSESTDSVNSTPETSARDDILGKNSPAGETPRRKDIISSLPEGKVALTFDDGPSCHTRGILDVLEEYHVPATFFFIGQNINRYPEAVKTVREQGHGIGLHSFSHQAMRDLSFDKQEDEVTSGLAVLKPYAGKVTLFRPPYGAYNNHTKEILHKHQLSMVLWNRDPQDWQARTTREIVQKVLNTTFSGGIYLLHENALTLEALPQIIEAFQEADMTFINLEKEIF